MYLFITSNNCIVHYQMIQLTSYGLLVFVESVFFCAVDLNKINPTLASSTVLLLIRYSNPHEKLPFYLPFLDKVRFEPDKLESEYLCPLDIKTMLTL